MSEIEGVAVYTDSHETYEAMKKTMLGLLSYDSPLHFSIRLE
jgi:hypothetical protein